MRNKQRDVRDLQQVHPLHSELQLDKLMVGNLDERRYPLVVCSKRAFNAIVGLIICVASFINVSNQGELQRV